MVGLYSVYSVFINHGSSTIADSSIKPSLQVQGDHFKIEPEASHAPQSNLKSSAKGKYGDEGYEELDK